MIIAKGSIQRWKCLHKILAYCNQLSLTVVERIIGTHEVPRSSKAKLPVRTWFCFSLHLSWSWGGADLELWISYSWSSVQETQRNKILFPPQNVKKHLGQNYSKFTLNCIKKQISSNFPDIGIWSKQQP
jgi:hypothetical protein